MPLITTKNSAFMKDEEQGLLSSESSGTDRDVEEGVRSSNPEGETSNNNHPPEEQASSEPLPNMNQLPRSTSNKNAWNWWPKLPRLNWANKTPTNKSPERQTTSQLDFHGESNSQKTSSTTNHSSTTQSPSNQNNSLYDIIWAIIIFVVTIICCYLLIKFNLFIHHQACGSVIHICNATTSDIKTVIEGYGWEGLALVADCAILVCICAFVYNNLVSLKNQYDFYNRQSAKKENNKSDSHEMSVITSESSTQNSVDEASCHSILKTIDAGDMSITPKPIDVGGQSNNNKSASITDMSIHQKTINVGFQPNNNKPASITDIFIHQETITNYLEYIKEIFINLDTKTVFLKISLSKIVIQTSLVLNISEFFGLLVPCKVNFDTVTKFCKQNFLRSCFEILNEIHEWTFLGLRMTGIIILCILLLIAIGFFISFFSCTNPSCTFCCMIVMFIFWLGVVVAGIILFYVFGESDNTCSHV